jgi:uncharacterized protein YgbK (DUF1537 family)
VITLGAIADDFTGATDLATALRQRGFRVVVVVEDTAVEAESVADVDAVVVALKTRTAPRDEATAATVAAARKLAALGTKQYYVKYCSTFDSTPDGNIGTALDAVLGELGERRAIVVPAFPDNGRTVYRGHLFVGDQLLAESPMRDHPLTPMTQSRVADILAPQTSRSVAEVTAPTVWAGTAQLADALEAHPDGYIVVDTTTNDDLERIAAATASWRVVSGGAGLALGMTGPAIAGTDDFKAPIGRRLVVCGSASAATRGQVAAAIASGLPAFKLDVTAMGANPASVIDSALAFIAASDEADVPVVYSVGSLDDVTRSTRDGRPVAGIVEQVIAAITRGAVEHLGVRQIIAAGGETSGSVVKALGAGRLRIGPQISPGVCWSLATASAGIPVALALKSGNFGAEHLFTTAWEALA